MKKESHKNISYRNPQIEMLRGIAIFIIVIYHIFNRYQQIYYNTSIWWMDDWGALGVMIFLMISAYFLLDPNGVQINLQQALKQFIHKLLRLWPCYSICITIVFLVTRIIVLPGRSVNSETFIANIFLINRFLSLPYVDGAHWYLSVLLSITFIALMLQVFRIDKNPKAYIGWMFLQLVLDVFQFPGEMYLLGGPYIGCVCLGIAVKFLLKILDQKADRKCQKKQMIGWGIVIVCSVAFVALKFGFKYLVELLVIETVIILCVFKKFVIPERTVLHYLGEASYAIYLIHQNLGFIIEMTLIDKIGSHDTKIAMTTSVLVIFIGIILYYFVEKPIQSRIKYIANSYLIG